MKAINTILEIVIGLCGLILFCCFVFCHEIKHWMDTRSGKYWKAFWMTILITAAVAFVAIIIKSLI